MEHSKTKEIIQKLKDLNREIAYYQDCFEDKLAIAHIDEAVSELENKK